MPFEIEGGAVLAASSIVRFVAGVADIKKLACERLNPSGAWEKLSEEAKDMVPSSPGR